VGADTRIEADTVDDVLGVKAFHLGVGVEFVEIADTEREIGVGKQLNRFRFGEAHDAGLDVRFDGSFLEQGSKSFCCLRKTGIAFDGADNDTRRVEIVVEGLGFAEEFGRKEDIVAVVFAADGLGVTYGDGRFDDHDGRWVDTEDGLDDILYSGSVEVIALTIIVCRSGYDDIFRIFVRGLSIEGRSKIELFFCEIFLDVLILDGGLAVVEHLDFFGDNVYRDNFVMLG